MLTALRTRLSAIEPRQWVGALVSVGAVLGIASLFFAEWLYGYWKPEPELYYFESWSDDRGYEEALAVQEEERRLSEQADAVADQLAAEALADFEDEPQESAAETAPVE
ncbi:hypothetical protein B5C34_09255 [Pacificimonas flava]|uniref:Uncharacterized protein n=2 Tax=Pacificimonas TaxID=1960290 RepID=A0A219B771_9SPHN|nr:MULTISPECIES: hypothetical protein [Pacificimonas]MBZ6379143.1 hypothetical protein [Pacificimonas aurantium]OWV33628.1 hypothetical protein B5C34_09255 [Pacificimonas flava]